MTTVRGGKLRLIAGRGRTQVVGLGFVVAAGAVGLGTFGPARSHSAPAEPLEYAAHGTNGHGTDEHEAVPITYERLHEINGILTEAKAAVAKYQDVDLARAEGYHQETPAIEGEGAHFVNPELLSADRFDPAHPPYLIYESGPGSSLQLAGVAWARPRQPGDSAPPPSPFAPLADWHTHSFTDICIRTRGAIEEAVAHIDPDECAAAGGIHTPAVPWLVHAWLFTPSPDGVFHHVNTALDGLDPLS